MRYTVTTSEYAVGGIIIRDGEHPIWMSVHDKNMLLSIATVLDNETAPLHAEIERLQAENAKIRKFVQDVGDLVMALPKDAPLALKYEGDSILLNSFREQAGELIAEWEESEADNA